MNKNTYLCLVTLIIFFIFFNVDAQSQYILINTSTVGTPHQFQCMQYFEMGSKHIFWDTKFSTVYYSYISQNINNCTQYSKLRTHSIIFYYDKTNISGDFTRYLDILFNQSIVDTVWLQPGPNRHSSNTSLTDTVNCDLARTAMYQCIRRNRKCGFYFNQTTFQALMGNQSCPQLSTFPLFYQGSSSNFKGFNGWNYIKYSKSNEFSNLCQLSVGITEKIIAGNQIQVEKIQNYERQNTMSSHQLTISSE